jgi:hypothetical protein
MREFFSGVPGRITAVILGIGAVITAIGAITGFFSSQVLQNTEDTIVAEIVLDASKTMSEPLSSRPGENETRWSSAKRFALDYIATRYEASNSYIALRHFGGSCASSVIADDARPTVDWPATRYYVGPWRILGGADNQSAVRAALDSVQPSGEATVWSAVEDAIGHLERGPDNLGKARRQLVLIYSGSAVDSCHQFALDRLAAQMSGSNIRFIPISLGEAGNGPENISTQVAQVAGRTGAQVASTSSQTQLDQVLRTALPGPTLTAAAIPGSPSATALPPTSAPSVTPTPRPAIPPTAPATSTPTIVQTATSTPRAVVTPTVPPAIASTVSPTATPTARPTTTPTPTPSTLSPSRR